MPVSGFQRRVLSIIASGRSPDSFIAGGLPLNRDGPRYSADIDIFHGDIAKVAAAAAMDIKLLRKSGLSVSVFREIPGIISADISDSDGATKLEWVADSDYRYFPVIPDADFGYMLHPVDLAMNKIMAAAGRREPRDIVDLVTIHEQHLRLGAVAVAAVVIAIGFTPESLLAEVRRNARYPSIEIERLPATQPLDAAQVMRRLRQALDEASRYVQRIPSEKIGRLFLEKGVPVEPDPDKLGDYEEHEPTRRGHWPSSSEIGSAMLERYVRRQET